MWAMVTNLVWTSLTAFFVLALFSPFLPLFLMWRSVTLSALAFTSYRLLQGPVHWSDQDAGYAIGMALLTLFIAAVLVALSLRLCVAAYYNWLTAGILIGENTRWIDRVLLVAIGATVGLIVAIGMTSLLGGSSGGRMLDVGIGIAASALIIFMAVHRASALAIPIIVLSIVLAIVSFTGARQTRHIVEGAETMANGRSWCLVVPKWRYQEPVMSDFGFFSLPKGGLLPHLVLIVRDGSNDIKAHWSIRKQRFVNGAMATDATCMPQANYKDRLSDG